MVNSALESQLTAQKADVRSYWEANACGEIYATGGSEPERFAAARRTRYELEPYIRPFADFVAGAGRDVLEIGVGLGCDHTEWARARPRRLAGVDLTTRAIDVTNAHLSALGLQSELHRADAEALPFPDESFDIVYSWGVLHHSPDTARAVREAHRVLRRGGVAKVMIYQRHSIVGWMLWLRYALLAGKPWRPLDAVLATHLESPGTKGYSAAEARQMFADFTNIDIAVQLNHGDLLRGEVGQRHRGILLSLAKALWPRWFIERALKRRGLYLLITATK